MSKTDKTRPWWVQLHDPALPTVVRHDHRHGECVEETLALAEQRQHHRSTGWRHRSSGQCPRYAWVHEVCESPETSRFFNCRFAGRRGLRELLSAHDASPSDAALAVALTPPWKCPGHTVLRLVAPDADCGVCDDLARLNGISCRPEFARRYGWEVSKVHKGSMGRSTKRMAKKARRHTVRQALKAAGRDWNTHGNTDLEPGRDIPHPPWWW